MSEKEILSEGKEFQVRNGTTLKVYPASLEVISLLDSKLKKLDSLTEKTPLKDQVDLFVDVVYDLVKDDNDITKEALKKCLTVKACHRIIQESVGSFV